MNWDLVYGAFWTLILIAVIPLNIFLLYRGSKEEDPKDDI